MVTGVQARKSPRESRSFSHATIVSSRRSHSMTTSVSRRYFPTSVGQPSFRALRPPQPPNERDGITHVAPVRPHARQPIDDGLAVLPWTPPILTGHGVAHERRYRRTATPTLGGEQAHHLLIDIELRSPHRRCMPYIVRRIGARVSLTRAAASSATAPRPARSRTAPSARASARARRRAPRRA